MKAALYSTLLALCALPFTVGSLFSQGPLTPPPGPPVPTMKRLSAIDPGRPLNPSSFGATGIVIDQPGSYYLTGNVTTVGGTETAIAVLASNVTIDLRGFALIASGGIGTGVGNVAIGVGTSQRNITVRNGSIRGTWWAGFYSPVPECAAEELRVAGTVAYGIRLDDRAQVRSCQVDGLTTAGSITSAGIFVEDDSAVLECTAVLCDGIGIQAGTRASVLDCIASRNTLNGMVVGDGSVVSRCASSLNTGEGIALAVSGTVTDCTAYDNGGSGITGTTGGNVTNTSAFSNGDRGFSFSSALLARNVAARNGAAGFVVAGASSLSQCVAGDNGEDGFNTTSTGLAFVEAVVFEGCVASNNGQTSANVVADGFEIAVRSAKMVRSLAVNNHGWGLRVTFGVASDCTVDGNLLIANDEGHILFSAGLAPLIIRNLVGGSGISPAPSASFDLVAPYGNAQSDQPFVNF